MVFVFNFFDMLLSLCIPTYNRCSHLDSLLRFLRNEILLLDPLPDIEIVVSDNCSDDNTEAVVSFYISEFKGMLRYHRHEQNIGAEGNFISLFHISNGDYVWLLGDDDLYYSGIISKVLDVLKSRRYSYIFINHRELINGKVVIPSVLNNVDIERENKGVLLDILNLNGPFMMFLSASIHRREVVIDFLRKRPRINMAFTLYLAFNSASHGLTKIMAEPLIDDECGNVAWKDLSEKVFFKDVPYVVFQTCFMGYGVYGLSSFLRYIYRKRGYYLGHSAIYRMLKQVKLIGKS